jgi:hypothetical protein
MNMKFKRISLVGLLCIFFIAPVVSAQKLGPLHSITAAEFLKLPEGIRAIYVSGVLDGLTFTTYGYSIPDHDRFVQCAQTLTIGALANRTVDWLKANPVFPESLASAVARTMGIYCKEKGLR